MRKIPPVLLVLALVKLAVHLVDNAWGGYGYFRDELYYIACAKHLAAGYVDQPPLSILFLALNRLLFGDSLFALRLLPAIAGALTVLYAGLMARELGGGKLSQALAASCVLAAPIFLAENTYYSMNSFDMLIWTLSGYLVMRLLKTGEPKYWIAIGVALGLGLMNKISVLWFGFGLFAGILLTPQRAWLKTRWPYLAGILSFVLFLPYVIWNLQHDMATLEFMRHATEDKYSTLNVLSFLSGQILLPNPVSLPVWLAGVIFLLRNKEFRLIAFIYLGAMAVLILNGHSKSEYLAPAYPMLFAAGGVALERWFAARSWNWPGPVYASLILLSGAFLAPAAFPVLPVQQYIRYARAIGIEPSTPEHKELAELPQFYADMFGWESKAEAVAKAFHSLSPEDQAKAAIFADNYGRCAAIDFFGKKYGLPDAIGNHNNYWIWGPGKATGELVIILGGDLEHKVDRFEKVEIAGTASCDNCMPYEKNLTVYICRNIKIPLADLWQRAKHYD